MRISRRVLSNPLVLAAVVLQACGQADETPNDPADVSADAGLTPDASSDSGALDADSGAPDADAAIDVTEADGTGDTNPGDVADVADVSDVSPTDLAAAEAVARAVFAELGLDPDDGSDVRTVWTDPPTYLAYLAAYAEAVGIELPVVEDAAKAECAHLTAFNPTVPYCGPGCANSLTVSPPCLNQACFEHDRCYAAYECESGVTIDVAQSFGALMTCCDAPLNTIWNACVGTVAADFAAGNIGASDVTLFNAVSALMVLMNASSVFDPPTGLTPATCEEEFREGCTGFTLEARVAPETIGAPSQTATVCATLDHGEGEPAAWTMRVTQAGPGSLVQTEVAGAPGAEACVEYEAPANLPPTIETVTFDVDALVDGDEVATDTVTLSLEGDAPSLDVVGDSSRTLFAGSPTIELCFEATDDGGPVEDVEVTATLAGDGLLGSATGSTDAAGRVCFDYTPPAEVPDAVEVLTASAEIDGRSLTATYAVTIEELAELVFSGLLSSSASEGSYFASSSMSLTVRVSIVDGMWTMVPEITNISASSTDGEVAGGCDNFTIVATEGGGLPTSVLSDGETPLPLTEPHSVGAIAPGVTTVTYRSDGDPAFLCMVRSDTSVSDVSASAQLLLNDDFTALIAVSFYDRVSVPFVSAGTLSRVE